MRDSAVESARFAMAMETVHLRSSTLRSAPWLRSDFDSPIWELALKGDSRIDFRVTLEDGSLLSDPKNATLLRTFKHFLVVQTSPEFTRGVVYADSSLAQRINPAIHICEYFLVRSEELQLARWGLAAFSESMAYQLLRDFALGACADAVYQWTNRLAALLVDNGSKLPGPELKRVILERADIIHCAACPELGLSKDQLVRARAWLWSAGLYRLATMDGRTRYVPDTTKLARILYPRGTLKSNWKRLRVPELELGTGLCLTREFESAPVRGLERSEAQLRYYMRALGALPILEREGFPFPASLTTATKDRAFIQQLGTAPVGRYRTLPHQLVLDALRHALEFSIEFGDHLIEAYLRIAKEALRQEKSLTTINLRYGEFAGPFLLAKGVRVWSLAGEMRTARCRGLDSSVQDCESQFFARMRANEGLLELLQVLWGAILISVGALMARRQGEILDLKADSYLDESETRLVFRARKRNVLNYREVLRRPMPPVLVGLLGKLKRLQDELIGLGVMTAPVSLFAFPYVHRQGLRDADEMKCNEQIDRFCDYFKIGMNEHGQRHYIRHHQLRRFFALLFFWGNSYSGLETLRWFIGHSDPEELYRYITEDTPGDALREIKVDYALEQLRSRHPSADGLAAALEVRFGVNLIQILESEELQEYLESQLLEAKLRIEPHFFQGHTGREYVMLIIVEGGGNDSC